MIDALIRWWFVHRMAVAASAGAVEPNASQLSKVSAKCLRDMRDPDQRFNVAKYP